ncbi:3-hydroxyacyl-CoA dehydrogenase / enoyl-CoA hydratase / 3-hydroxybutyryl-CoA epimerase [Steroidobacter denitrificans]|uniref:3-hydroxyacyl-CoA dehydrogenase / enoyl-CoA hydratase / 3-hydroxybutyryl-CoA epimerase n=2 Tax=Steroidobacter denitrificans TaxID=465721 RepID=A0A127FBS0_STEDE|nr:3-hydroxyacyl-CoA dehydrogenase / enoyl-CoA hydratase / 3-hydroxybutyryl-CoA epimerase [Steroidobacter denitrificans]
MTDTAHRPAHWRLQTDTEGLAWLSLDKVGASTNSLSRDVMEQLGEQLAHIEANLPKALILTSAKQGFIAGADIKEFLDIDTPEQAYALIRAGQRVLDRLAALKCVTVAAINGHALGGGLEMALACRYRVLADEVSATLGFPEVQLGVHPGFGGTVRAVQLTGPIAALDLMLTGRMVRPKQALQLGLVDRLSPPRELAAQARVLATHPPPRRRVSLKNRLLNSAALRPIVAGQLRSRVARQVRPAHYPAPYALVDLWQRHGGRGERAYEAEAHSMARLLCSPTSRNLVRVFFLQDRLKSLGRTDANQAGKEPVQHVHVIGAGVMGGDIASWCALRGLTVTLQDRAVEYVKPALERAQRLFEKRYQDEARRAAASARLRMDVEGQGVAHADVVIEAIFENLEAKQSLYAEVEPRLKSSALLATNTSSIVLERLADKLAAPRRLIGLHFFNPVAHMPLVEVIHTRDTDAGVLRAGLAFARRLDKLPLPCRSSPGFLVNRVLMPYLGEALRAAEEGIALIHIDRAAEAFGMPMGPIELADMVGLDVIAGVSQVFLAPDIQLPTLLTTRQALGKLGKKTGEGFYVWRDGKPVKPSAGAAAAPEDLQDRLLLPLINEAVAVLREQVVEDEDLVDAGVIFGAGFAPFLGGPLRYARQRGVTEILACLEKLRESHGERFAADAGWSALR